MTYRCAVTGQTSKFGEKLNKIVIATRPKEYFKDVKNEDTDEWETVPAARGYEVVKEIGVSKRGLAEWEAMSAEQKQLFIQRLTNS